MTTIIIGVCVFVVLSVGYYCGQGSTTPHQFECGSTSVFCVRGSSQPMLISPGFYGAFTGTNAGTRALFNIQNTVFIKSCVFVYVVFILLLMFCYCWCFIVVVVDDVIFQTFSAEIPCEPGYFCSGGVKYPCPPGTIPPLSYIIDLSIYVPICISVT